MNLRSLWQLTPLISLGLLASALPVRAEAPGLYYSWRAIEADLTDCIDRSTAALTAEEMTNIQVEGTSISGNLEDTSAAVICMTDTSATTVMIIVSSTNDDRAVELREALKVAF